MAIVRNLATGKTTTDITSSATSIPVNRVDVFGASQNPLDNPFYVTIMPASGDEPANLANSEIALVTGISGTNLTVTRGQRSTTAKAFSSGAIVTMAIYAEDAVLLADSGVSGGSTYRKKLVDKDGNTIIPIMGYMGTVYTATLSTATAGETARYDFTTDTPVENNKIYAVKFPDPTVNNATIILGDSVVSGSILVPPVAATDSPNYELLNTDMINSTEPLLLMYNGVQWVCLNQKKKVATADLEDNAITSDKVDWSTFKCGIVSDPVSDTIPANGMTRIAQITLPKGKYALIATASYWANAAARRCLYISFESTTGGTIIAMINGLYGTRGSGDTLEATNTALADITAEQATVSVYANSRDFSGTFTRWGDPSVLYFRVG